MRSDQPIANPITGISEDGRIGPGPGGRKIATAPLPNTRDPMTQVWLVRADGHAHAGWSRFLLSELRHRGIGVWLNGLRCCVPSAIGEGIRLYSESPAFWHMDLWTFLRTLGVMPADRKSDQESGTYENS